MERIQNEKVCLEQVGDKGEDPPGGTPGGTPISFIATTVLMTSITLAIAFQ